MHWSLSHLCRYRVSPWSHCAAASRVATMGGIGARWRWLVVQVVGIGCGSHGNSRHGAPPRIGGQWVPTGMNARGGGGRHA